MQTYAVTVGVLAVLAILLLVALHPAATPAGGSKDRYSVGYQIFPYEPPVGTWSSYQGINYPMSEGCATALKPDQVSRDHFVSCRGPPCPSDTIAGATGSAPCAWEASGLPACPPECDRDAQERSNPGGLAAPCPRPGSAPPAGCSGGTPRCAQPMTPAIVRRFDAGWYHTRDTPFYQWFYGLNDPCCNDRTDLGRFLNWKHYGGAYGNTFSPYY